MAIRKDLDDMLNSLMDSGGGSSSTPARSHNTPRSVRKSKFDDMSVDDLLHALEDEKKHSYDEPAPAENISDDTPPSVWEFAPPTESAPEPEPQEEEEEVPNIISEVMHTEASAEMTRVFDTIPMTEEFPKPAKKKKIVITGELPDYEALRREEAEREKQAKLAAEAAAEEARAAERARRAAEAAAERQRLAEEAEQRRLARIEAENQRRVEEERQRMEEEAERARRIAEAAAEKKRLAEEAERQRLAEEAERARLAEEEAERQRLLAEEAERQRLAEEEAERARIAQEEERLRRIEEMKRLAEEAESKESSPVTFDEEIIVNSSSDNAVDEAIESLGEAAEAPAENITPEVQEEAEKPKKLGFFKKLMNKSKEEAAPDTETEAAPEDGLFEHDDAPSATELIDAAIAAINGSEDKTDNTSSSESDPVGNMLDNIREDAKEAIADMDTPREEDTSAAAPDEPLIMTDEEVISGLSPELKERFDELSADKQQQVIEMRRAQMGAVAPTTVNETEAIESPDVQEDENEGVSAPDETKDTQQEEAVSAEAEKPADTSEFAPKKPKGKVTSALGRILDEDPDELIAQRRENIEPDDITAADPYKKKRLYTVLGVIFTIFAVIGIIATIFKCVGFFRSFTSGEVKKDGFTQMIYPAVIMDIEPFSSPSQLTSEQIITATIWSIIMDDSKISKYEPTLDTVSIPDVDVEKYAVELFGENLPAFTHTTVGPLESRFYYADGVYNVKLKPITHTYSPEIKSIVKNGSDYTLTVDYVDELPQWMDKNVSKNVEFRLTEKDDGTFRISSMKILSVNNGNL